MRDYSFGNFLHELRLRRGLTQYRLGALVGVSDKAVSKWENGSSKPQSDILYQLSDVLGVSVDELLTCRYHPSEKRGQGVFAMKKQLWNKVFAAMSERYGDPAPMEMTNRLLTEYAEMQNTDMIVYFDLLSVLSSAAGRQGEHACVRGGTGASFTAYLLGATRIDPLRPHYVCPGCRSVLFEPTAGDGWDLPERVCSCGRMMRSDGHNIPFETYRNVIHRNIGFDISVSPEFLGTAESIVQDYFKDCRLAREEREPGRVLTFTVLSETSGCSVTLCADDELTRCKALERVTATCFERVQSATPEILKEFREGNTDGITGFENDFMKNMLLTLSPRSFHELLRISGLAHGTGVWADNGKQLVESGHPAADVIAYRDDVFCRVQEKMLAKGFSDTGFAYKVMEDTRRGLYAQNGIPEHIRRHLVSVGMEDWFVGSIGKIRYLFPKAQGVTCVMSAVTLMWYKVHYPKEFGEIMR